MADNNNKKRKQDTTSLQRSHGSSSGDGAKGQVEQEDDPRDAVIAKLQQENAELRSLLAKDRQFLLDVDNCRHYTSFPDHWKKDPELALRYLESLHVNSRAYTSFEELLPDTLLKDRLF